MPLSFMDEGQSLIVQRISGNPEMRSHLEGLGFVPGASVTIVSKSLSGLIVNVKDARVALGSDLASKVFV